MGHTQISDAPSRSYGIPVPAIVSRFKDVDGQSARHQHAMIFIVKVDRLYIGKAKRRNLFPGITCVRAAEKSSSRREPDVAAVVHGNGVDGKISIQRFRRQPAFTSTHGDGYAVAAGNRPSFSR